MKISKEFKVGGLSLIAMVILYFGVRFMKGIDFFSSSTTYYAVYDRIDGLQVSNSVTINGLTVGRVSSVEIEQDRNNRILVSLDLEKDIVVGKESVAELTDEGLLGGKIVELKLEGGSPLQEGDTIKTSVSKGISGLMEDKALPVIQKFDSTMLILNAILTEYEGMGEDVRRLMGNTADVSGTVSSTLKISQRDLLASIDSFRVVSENLAATSRTLEPLMGKIDSFADSLNNMQLAELTKQTNQTVTEMKNLMEKLNSQEGTMGKMMNDKALYDNLNTSIQSLDSLLVDLREHPKRYVHFSVFGRKNK